MSTKQLEKQKTGRPSVMTADVIRKLEVAFAAGFGVTASCYYSGISTSTYYEHVALNKDFSDKMNLAQEFSTHRARQVVLQAINNGDVKAAQWWLEHKARLEFAPPKAY